MTLKDLIKPQESYRRYPYLDSVGVLTIGYGRNLRDRGISAEELAYLGRTLEDIKKNGVSEGEAGYLLDNDIKAAIQDCRCTFSWFNCLDNVRQAVVADMVFNMGLGRFLGFKDTIAAIRAGDFKKAADEMLDSTWHKQVGARAEKLAQMMETGHV